MAAATWFRLPWRDRLLLAEALALLAIAALCIAALPFRRIAALAARDGHRAPAPAALIRRLRWAIDASARRAPWRAKCFEQGLAAQWMLRRRHYASTLHYGARRDPAGGLAAHVWVRSGETDVVGRENAGDYGLLASFGS